MISNERYQLINCFQGLAQHHLIIIIIKNLYSAKTIEEYSKALYIELIKQIKMKF